MAAEWFLAHHLDQVLASLLFVAAIYVRLRARRTVRLWFSGVMVTVAIACIALIHFCPDSAN